MPKDEFNSLLYEMYRVEKLRESLQCVVLALQWDEQGICSGEHVYGDKAKSGWAVDKNEIVLGTHMGEGPAH